MLINSLLLHLISHVATIYSSTMAFNPPALEEEVEEGEKKEREES